MNTPLTPTLIRIAERVGKSPQYLLECIEGARQTGCTERLKEFGITSATEVANLLSK